MLMPLFDEKAEFKGDSLDPNVETRYLNAIESVVRFHTKFNLSRTLRFFTRAKQAYAVVVSGEIAKYGNIIIKRGYSHFINNRGTKQNEQSRIIIKND